ncbi:MAG: hypothetical protein JRJ42_04970 [Deltaproteobacteria bacterium]|nr:hypothetical protein [Deltaproteobacteria bacterium]MBW2019748.1 hypothetical protein [Deltaproteobacteria bacterium]MBW2074584.1 hypothetical protein [Deltaproteobacteria bacterium]RLB83441.1 MAG: hypothetical protein DRH17_02160 [Deltaproteobacteria bacterium]
MTVKDAKQTDTDPILGGARSSKNVKSGGQPGYINFGSYLDPYNSLSARVKAEIDRRLCGCREDNQSK